MTTLTAVKMALEAEAGVGNVVFVVITGNQDPGRPGYRLMIAKIFKTNSDGVVEYSNPRYLVSNDESVCVPYNQRTAQEGRLDDLLQYVRNQSAGGVQYGVKPGTTPQYAEYMDGADLVRNAIVEVIALTTATKTYTEETWFVYKVGAGAAGHGVRT